MTLSSALPPPLTPRAVGTPPPGLEAPKADAVAKAVAKSTTGSIQIGDQTFSFELILNDGRTISSFGEEAENVASQVAEIINQSGILTGLEGKIRSGTIDSKKVEMYTNTQTAKAKTDENKFQQLVNHVAKVASPVLTRPSFSGLPSSLPPGMITNPVPPPPPRIQGTNPEHSEDFNLPPPSPYANPRLPLPPRPSSLPYGTRINLTQMPSPLSVNLPKPPPGPPPSRAEVTLSATLNVITPEEEPRTRRTSSRRPADQSSTNLRERPGRRPGGRSRSRTPSPPIPKASESAASPPPPAPPLSDSNTKNAIPLPPPLSSPQPPPIPPSPPVNSSASALPSPRGNNALLAEIRGGNHQLKKPPEKPSEPQGKLKEAILKRMEAIHGPKKEEKDKDEEWSE